MSTSAVVDTSQLPIRKRDDLQAMRDAWQATARYRVVRDDRNPDWRATRTTLATGLTWGEARTMAEQADAVISALDPFHGIGGTMSRSVHFCELETAPEPERRCACGCGSIVAGRAVLASPACRKRAQRRRDRLSLSQRAIAACDSPEKAHVDGPTRPQERAGMAGQG